MTKTRALLSSLALATLAACGSGGARSPEAICKKLGALAEKDGGQAKELWASNLAKDCVKEMGEEKTRLGDAKFDQAADCMMKAATFMDAMTCAE